MEKNKYEYAFDGSSRLMYGYKYVYVMYGYLYV